MMEPNYNDFDDTISSTMPASEIIALLAVRGRCPDITDELVLAKCGRGPVCGGGFGDVYRGALQGGSQIAIKCARLYLQYDDTRGHKILKRVARELYTWSRFDHNNILPLLGLTQFRGHMAMVSPWMDNGNLLNYIKRHPTVDRCKLMIGISRGLNYLHKRGAVHGDIKSANILISRAGIPKLADFGCTQRIQSTLQFTTTTGIPGISMRWAAPEVLSGILAQSKEADIYALGMTLLEAITGNVPFHNDLDLAVVRMVYYERKTPERPESFTTFNQVQADLLWGILSGSWSYEPGSRPDAKAIRDRLRVVRRYARLSSHCGSSLDVNLSTESSMIIEANPAFGDEPPPFEGVSMRINRGVSPMTLDHSGVDDPSHSATSIDPQPSLATSTSESFRSLHYPMRKRYSEQAAIEAHERALEEARKLAEDEDEGDESEVQMQRHLMTRVCEKSDQGRNDDGSENEMGSEEYYSTSDSSTLSERACYAPSQPSRSDPEACHCNGGYDGHSDDSIERETRVLDTQPLAHIAIPHTAGCSNCHDCYSPRNVFGGISLCSSHLPLGSVDINIQPLINPNSGGHDIQMVDPKDEPPGTAVNRHNPFPGLIDNPEVLGVQTTYCTSAAQVSLLVPARVEPSRPLNQVDSATLPVPEKNPTYETQASHVQAMGFNHGQPDIPHIEHHVLIPAPAPLHPTYNPIPLLASLEVPSQSSESCPYTEGLDISDAEQGCIAPTGSTIADMYNVDIVQANHVHRWPVEPPLGYRAPQPPSRNRRGTLARVEAFCAMREQGWGEGVVQSRHNDFDSSAYWSRAVSPSKSMMSECLSTAAVAGSSSDEDD